MKEHTKHALIGVLKGRAGKSLAMDMYDRREEDEDDVSEPIFGHVSRWNKAEGIVQEYRSKPLPWWINSMMAFFLSYTLLSFFDEHSDYIEGIGLLLLCVIGGVWYTYEAYATYFKVVWREYDKLK